MPGWMVEGSQTIELDDVRDVKIRIVGGSVSVTAAQHGEPPRLEVESIQGGPVDVHHELGSLRVFHPEWAWAGWRRILEGLTVSADIKIGSFTFPGVRAPECRIVLRVPAESRLDASTVNAAVTVSGLRTPVHLKTVSGDLTLADITDLVDARTVSGEVAARGLAGDLKAKTVSGDVSVVGGSSSWVDAKTVSGDVTLDLDLDPRGVYEFITVSGDVGLRLPDEPDVMVELSSVSGALDTDFGLSWDDHRGGRKRIRERLGSGSARLFVRTVSGSTRLIRRRAVA